MGSVKGLGEVVALGVSQTDILRGEGNLGGSTPIASVEENKSQAAFGKNWPSPKLNISKLQIE